MKMKVFIDHKKKNAVEYEHITVLSVKFYDEEDSKQVNLFCLIVLLIGILIEGIVIWNA